MELSRQVSRQCLWISMKRNRVSTDDLKRRSTSGSYRKSVHTHTTSHCSLATASWKKSQARDSQHIQTPAIKCELKSNQAIAASYMVHNPLKDRNATPKLSVSFFRTSLWVRTKERSRLNSRWFLINYQTRRMCANLRPQSLRRPKSWGCSTRNRSASQVLRTPSLS